MTTLQMQTTSNLEASATEDPMELTSEMDRRFGADDDIDIDLDLTVDNYQYEEDEYMGEDVNVFTDMASTNGQDMQAGNDDEMADDTYAEGSIAGQSSVRDEDLEDAGDAELYPGDEDTIVEAHLEHLSDIPQGVIDKQDQISTDPGQDPDYLEQPSTQAISGIAPGSLSAAQKERNSPPETSTIVTQETLQELAPHYDETSRHEDEKHQYIAQEPQREYEDQTSRREGESHWDISNEPHQGDENDIRKQETSGYEYSTDVFSDNLQHVSETTIEQPEKQEAVGASPKEGSPLLPKAKDDRPEEYRNEPDEATSREPAHVHPVIVLYQDNEISLFPPIDSDDEHTNTYFLQSEEVAGDSIKALFDALRSILGESISEQEELMLDINDLDLHISESTIDSSTTTLLQIIDVYNHLQHYDGIENVPPLYVHLTTKASFSHRFEFLLNAIVEGKGLSQLRSSEVGEEIQQPALDGVQGHEAGDALPQDDVTRDTEAEVAEQEEILESENVHDEDNLPSESSPLRQPSKDTTTAKQDFAPPNKFVDSAGKETDDIEAYSETNESQGDEDHNEKHKIKESQEEESHEEEDINEATQTSEEALIPSASIPSGERLAQKPVEATVDEEDTVEYEDEEELTYGTSTGSSTLQGDVFDTNADHDQAETEGQIASTPAKDFDDTPNLLDPTAEPENYEDLAEKEEVATNENDGDLIGDRSDLSQPTDGPVAAFPAIPAQTELESPIVADDDEPPTDEDEITYEDEDDVETPEEPVNLERIVASSPGSLKHARSLDGDDDALENESQGAKRVRSG